MGEPKIWRPGALIMLGALVALGAVATVRDVLPDGSLPHRGAKRLTDALTRIAATVPVWVEQ